MSDEVKTVKTTTQGTYEKLKTSFAQYASLIVGNRSKSSKSAVGCLTPRRNVSLLGGGGGVASYKKNGDLEGSEIMLLWSQE